MSIIRVTAQVFDSQGTLQGSGTANRHGNTITITVDVASNHAWFVCLRGVKEASCTGGVLEPSAEGVKVIPHAGETQLTVSLS